MSKPYVIGITGCSGSGKTYFLHQFAKKFKQDEMSVLSMDNYYKPIQEQKRDEHNVVNFDLPESIDSDIFLSDLTELINGRPIEFLEYAFNKRDAEPNVIQVKPSPILVVEGIFPLYYEKIRNLLDYTVFIKASEETMLQRRIKRDGAERGYHDRSVKYRFEHHVLPTYRKCILPSQDHADLIVDNEIGFQEDLEQLTEHLTSELD